MEWELKKLGDVCQIFNGGTPKTTNKSYWGGQLKWLTPKDMGRLGGRNVSDSDRKITEDGLRNSSARLIPSNSIILSSRAPIGYVFINTEEMSFNQGCKGLVPKENLLVEFLYYFLFSSKELLNELGSGTTFKEISGKTLACVEILIPPLPEQKRIVAKLDKAFTEIEDILKITKKEEKIVIEALQASLMKKLFIPDEKINSDWEDLELTNVCTLLNGRAYKKPELLQEGKYPVLRVGNFFTNTNWYYSNLELEDNKYCHHGDLLYAWSASFGPRLWEGEKVIYHYHIWRIDINEKLVDKRFLFYWFDFDKELIKSASGTGTTMMHVSKSSMEKRRINLPPLPEQKLIAEQLDKVFTEVKLLHNVLQKKIEQISFLKSAILKKELQGEAA